MISMLRREEQVGVNQAQGEEGERPPGCSPVFHCTLTVFAEEIGLNCGGDSVWQSEWETEGRAQNGGLGDGKR